MGRFTDEQIDFVKNISLTGLAESMGYTVIKKGHYHVLKEMDSLTIYNDRTWYRWSQRGDKKGGSTIDFLIEYGRGAFNASENMVAQAVNYLLEYGGYNSLSAAEKRSMVQAAAIQNNKSIVRSEPEKEKRMEMPPKVQGGYKRAYAYLLRKRGISAETINYFVKNELLYEDAEHHNIVFLGYDRDRNIRFATKRGTCDINGFRYRGDVAGNDKRYGVSIVNENSDTLNVFEACIDMMSYCDLCGETDRTNKLALSMLDDAPLETFLHEHPQIKNINLYMDNDEPGIKASIEMRKKYEALGYNTENFKVPEGKDVNEYLLIRIAQQQRKNKPVR